MPLRHIQTPDAWPSIVTDNADTLDVLGGRTCICLVYGQLGFFGHFVSKCHRRTLLSCMPGRACRPILNGMFTLGRAQAPIRKFRQHW